MADHWNSLANLLGTPSLAPQNRKQDSGSGSKPLPAPTAPPTPESIDSAIVEANTESDFSPASQATEHSSSSPKAEKSRLRTSWDAVASFFGVAASDTETAAPEADGNARPGIKPAQGQRGNVGPASQDSASELRPPSKKSRSSMWNESESQSSSSTESQPTVSPSHDSPKTHSKGASERNGFAEDAKSVDSVNAEPEIGFGGDRRGSRRLPRRGRSSADQSPETVLADIDPIKEPSAGRDGFGEGLDRPSARPSRNNEDRSRPSVNREERSRPSSRDNDDRARPSSRDSDDRSRPSSRDSDDRPRPNGRDSDDRARPSSRDSDDRARPSSRNSEDRARPSSRDRDDSPRPSNRDIADRSRPSRDGERRSSDNEGSSTGGTPRRPEREPRGERVPREGRRGGAKEQESTDVPVRSSPSDERGPSSSQDVRRERSGTSSSDAADRDRKGRGSRSEGDVNDRSEPRPRSFGDRGGSAGRSTDSESRTHERNDRRPSSRKADKFQEEDRRASGGFGAGIDGPLDDRNEDEPFDLGADLEAFDPLDDDPRDDLDADSISNEGSDSDGRNTRRRRRRRGGKDRDNDEPKDRVKAGRRNDDRGGDDSDGMDSDGESDHGVRISKVPTWTETILVVVEANMANHQKSPQSGRGPSRGRGRR